MFDRRALLVGAVATVLVLGFGLAVVPEAAAGHSASVTTAATASPSASSSSAPAPSTTTPSATGASSTQVAYEQSVLANAKARDIPQEALSLPDLLGHDTVSGGLVQTSYTTAPAPMGIGDWGVENVSGTATAYTLETSSWEGSLTLNSIDTFLPDNDGPDTFGVQLNAVTTNTTVLGNSSFSYWIQNVLYYTPSEQTVIFLDNIWNFSSPTALLPTNTLYSYGGYPSGDFYYDFGPELYLPLPFTANLYINSSVTDDVQTGLSYVTVTFGFNLLNSDTGISEYSGVYDTVEFNSSAPIGTVPASPFLVDGSQLTPTGYLPYDAELMIGGPGGGTTTSVYGISGSESLRYETPSGAYANAPSAWDVAADTGETSEGISETWTHAGTVGLASGPSIPMPFWNATPGGNRGATELTGTLSPANAFLFATPGVAGSVASPEWVPTGLSSAVDLTLPPGDYSFEALLSDHASATRTVDLGSRGASASWILAYDPQVGIDTPLVAWGNAELSAIASGGHGTSASPYLLDTGRSPGGYLNSVFSMSNDYLYPVFVGVMLVGVTAHVDLVDPSSFAVQYPASLDAALESLDLPTTNNLQIEVYDSSNFVLWGAHDLTGWFFVDDYGPVGYLPLANVLFWGVTDSLIGDNTFVSEGSSLLLMNGTGNVVWGNVFVNGSVSPDMLFGEDPVGIWTFEAGDLLYNNYVDTTITAYEADVNLWSGYPQVNLENWNLSHIESARTVSVVDGFALTGSIVGSAWVCGNFWGSYVPGSGLPYNDYGFIEEGGDYCPYPIVAHAVTFSEHGLAPGASWTVTLNGYAQSSTGSTIVFYEETGAYAYSVSSSDGQAAAPSAGTVVVGGHGSPTVSVAFASEHSGRGGGYGHRFG